MQDLSLDILSLCRTIRLQIYLDRNQKKKRRKIMSRLRQKIEKKKDQKMEKLNLNAQYPNTKSRFAWARRRKKKHKW
jgi:hypothetical protein